MDKVLKLRRYTRKDYTLLVDFPVEIVGRDGVVRRYTFEESVRLYQRRIASAPTRYPDREVAEAEVTHCRRRIEQLRRSYYARYGWFSVNPPAGMETLEEDLAGEVAAFLRRCAEGTELEPESLRVTLLAQSRDPFVFYVERVGESDAATGPFLLYLYRFVDDDGGASREGFFTFLKILQGVRHAAEGVETLVAFHHTADCGLVLTGRPSDGIGAEGRSAGMFDLPPLDGLMQDEARPPDPLREGWRALRAGRHREALATFLGAYEQNPWRRGAALGAAALADALGQPAQAETVAELASRYFPDDPEVWYQLALARLRLGDPAGVERALASMVEAGGDGYPCRLLGTLAAMRSGRPLSALRRLWGLRDAQDPEPELVSVTRQAARRLLLWLTLRAVAGAGVLAVFLALHEQLPFALIGTGLALFAWVTVDAATFRFMNRALSDPAKTPLARLASLPRSGETLTTSAQ